MHWNEQYTRRNLIRALLVGAVTVGLRSVASLARNMGSDAEAAEKVDLKLIDEQKDFSAKALGFFHDGNKTARKDPREHCSNCKQYKKVGVVDGIDVGKCSLLAKGLVKSTGWCKSYLKDPALYSKS